MPSNIDIPNFTAEKLAEVDNSVLQRLSGDQKKMEGYLQSLLEAGRLVMTNDVLSSMDFDDESIEFNGQQLKTVSHSPSDASGRKVTGKAASIRAQSRAGGGIPTPVMLPHSGIWVTLLPAGESRMLDLWRTLTQDRVILGRYTYGTIFSATSIVTLRRMLEFCLAHVEAHSVNLKDSDLTLEDLILMTDVPFLLNGMGMSMYPRGIDYSSPCIVDPTTCTHVDTGKLIPSSLARYNNSAIPDSVKSTLASSSPASVTPEALLLYQSSVASPQMDTLVDETDLPVNFHYKVPSIRKAFSVGEQWVNGVHDAVINALSMETPTTSEEWSERNLHITRAGKASFMRQYAAWVDMIDMYESGIVDTEDDIGAVCESLSSSDKLRVDMITSVEAFIRRSTIGVIGYPVHECPACKRRPAMGGNQMVALDPVRLFFKYLVLRVDRVQQRSLL